MHGSVNYIGNILCILDTAKNIYKIDLKKSKQKEKHIGKFSGRVSGMMMMSREETDNGIVSSTLKNGSMEKTMPIRVAIR